MKGAFEPSESIPGTSKCCRMHVRKMVPCISSFSTAATRASGAAHGRGGKQRTCSRQGGRAAPSCGSAAMCVWRLEEGEGGELISGQWP